MQFILGLAPRGPRGSLVPYKSEEHQFCGALLTERTVCVMGLITRALEYINNRTGIIRHGGLNILIFVTVSLSKGS